MDSENKKTQLLHEFDELAHKGVASIPGRQPGAYGDAPRSKEEELRGHMHELLAASGMNLVAIDLVLTTVKEDVAAQRRRWSASIESSPAYKFRII
jgi:hypothetical protein